MLSFLFEERDGQIFINAAGGDTQDVVDCRAARIALRKNKPVNVQLINKKQYRWLDLSEAQIIMTPKAWIKEMRNSLSGDLTCREVNLILTNNMKKRIVADLKRERKQLHQKCLSVDREITIFS